MGDELAKGYRGNYPHPQTIRYADDFVIICPTWEAAEKAKEQAEAWLKKMGLELHVKKTR